jgi:hypothetical protein
MFTGRIIKRAFNSGEKREKEKLFCEEFPELIEQQKTLGRKFRKALKDEEPCVQMPDIVHEFVGKSSGRRFVLYRSDPALQTNGENREEVNKLGYKESLDEENYELLDKDKLEFDGYKLENLLEKAKENDDTFDKNNSINAIFISKNNEKYYQYSGDLDNSGQLIQNREEYGNFWGSENSYGNEKMLNANIYYIMEVPFWYYLK